MASLISVDPGLRATGIAEWNQSGQLLCASLLQIPKERSQEYCWFYHATAVAQKVYQSAGAASLVIEFPQTYGGRAKKGDANDLLMLAGLVGAIAGNFIKPSLVRPREWKGQLPKAISEARAKKILSPNELGRIQFPVKSLQHNVWDAIGIGLWYLGREKPGLAAPAKTA